jgi:hypothetical protein
MDIPRYKQAEVLNMRKVITRSWANINTADTINEKKRVLTPFRAANNLGDFLARKNYVTDGPNPQSASRPGYARLIGSIRPNPDNSGVVGASCNPKFVSDSSDYIKFKRQVATIRNFNDLSFGGYNNASYVAAKKNV